MSETGNIIHSTGADAVVIQGDGLALDPRKAGAAENARAVATLGKLDQSRGLTLGQLHKRLSEDWRYVDAYEKLAGTFPPKRQPRRVPRARTGQIGRLPRDLQSEVNRRLRDGKKAKEIAAWLNAQPRVQEVLERLFKGQPIRPQNLSEWRKDGYHEWLQTEDSWT